MQGLPDFKINVPGKLWDSISQRENSKNYILKTVEYPV